MKHYKVEITKSALQDMEDIYNYIAEELLSPENAMGQYNRIADAILSLDIFRRNTECLRQNLRIRK